MPASSSATAFGYWSREGDLGVAAGWEFCGRDGLDRLSGPADVSAEDPARFRGHLTRVQLDHVALEVFQATPHRYARTRRHIEGDPTALLTVLLLKDGAMHLESEDASFDLRTGGLAVIDSREPLTYRTSADARMLRSVVGIEHIPQELRRPGTAVSGELPPTALTDSFVGFVSSILRTAVDGRPARGTHLIHAVADLQSAVLAESQQSVLAREGAAGLRYRMEEYIEGHYMDPDIDPAAVARAVSISLRHAHAVYGDGERTIARSIQDRRIAAIALELRTRDEPVQFAHLAKRYGFGSPDTLGRAFRQRFGMTLTDYRTGGHRSAG